MSSPIVFHRLKSQIQVLRGFEVNKWGIFLMNYPINSSQDDLYTVCKMNPFYKLITFKVIFFFKIFRLVIVIFCNVSLKHIIKYSAELSTVIFGAHTITQFYKWPTCELPMKLSSVTLKKCNRLKLIGMESSSRIFQCVYYPGTCLWPMPQLFQSQNCSSCNLADVFFIQSETQCTNCRANQSACSRVRLSAIANCDWKEKWSLKLSSPACFWTCNFYVSRHIFQHNAANKLPQKVLW